MIKRGLTVVLCVMAFGFVGVAQADDDFYGIVEKRPEGQVGTWVIGGRSVEVVESTEIDTDHGELSIGACVEVDIDDGKVEEIESEPPRKCEK